MSPRFGAPSHTIFDSNVGGWGQPQYFVTLNDPNPPFPFAVGRQFHMKIKAASDNLVQVDVDGSYYGTSNPTPLSIATVTKVTFSNVNVAELDLCHNHAYRTIMWWLLFILCTCLCVTTDTEAVIETSFSRVEATQKYVTGSHAVTSARSKTDCARICRKYSHCISWAFDKLTTAVCSESDAPPVDDHVTWQRTLTSLTSSPVPPTCDAGFVAGGDYMHPMRCLGSGQWDTGQQYCTQHIWTNIPVSVDGNYYGTGKPTPVTIAMITSVTVYGLPVTMLDVWCAA
ncbi:hypothetical protein BaRGS_00034499 [Batillaria attramentaria]|uniref:Galectin domain-containing protein n=1 Tax=Batillaria attramentaria TaxID=370345 RepID=A0ABD0JHW1_9CAEN